MRGIEPRASRMQSERSTIWATSPYWFSYYNRTKNSILFLEQEVAAH